MHFICRSVWSSMIGSMSRWQWMLMGFTWVKTIFLLHLHENCWVLTKFLVCLWRLLNKRNKLRRMAQIILEQEQVGSSPNRHDSHLNWIHIEIPPNCHDSHLTWKYILQVFKTLTWLDSHSEVVQLVMTLSWLQRRLQNLNSVSSDHLDQQAQLFVSYSLWVFS